MSGETCGCCGRTCHEEPIHFRGVPVCGAECYSRMSYRHSDGEPDVVMRWRPAGSLKVDKSGYWTNGREPRDE